MLHTTCHMGVKHKKYMIGYYLYLPKTCLSISRVFSLYEEDIHVDPEREMLIVLF